MKKIYFWMLPILLFNLAEIGEATTFAVRKTYEMGVIEATLTVAVEADNRADALRIGGAQIDTIARELGGMPSYYRPEIVENPGPLMKYKVTGNYSMGAFLKEKTVEVLAYSKKDAEIIGISEINRFGRFQGGGPSGEIRGRVLGQACQYLSDTRPLRSSK